MKVEAEDARHQNSMRAPPRLPRPKSPSGKREESPFEERYMLKLIILPVLSLAQMMLIKIFTGIHPGVCPRTTSGPGTETLTSDSVPHLRPHEPVTVTCILLI